MLCSYGCGSEGVFYFKSVKKWCCVDKHAKCPEVRRKNGVANIGKNVNLGRQYKQRTVACNKCGQSISAANIKRHESACGKIYIHKCDDTSCSNTWTTNAPSKNKKYCSPCCSKSNGSAKLSRYLTEAYASGKIRPYGGGMRRHQYTKYDGVTIIVQGSYELRTCCILDAWFREGKLCIWDYCADSFQYLDESGKQRTYFPDFKVYTTANKFFYLETKGYKTQRDELKWAAVKSAGFDIVVWFEADISEQEDDKVV